MDKIGNRFHGSSCSLRYNGTICTCGLEERLEAEKIEKERLKAKKNAKGNPKSAIKELIYVSLFENAELCCLAEKEYDELVYTSKLIGEPMRELIRMARVIARGYLYEVGMDGAPQPEEQADDIADMAFKVLEGSWITRTYIPASAQERKK